MHKKKNISLAFAFVVLLLGTILYISFVGKTYYETIPLNDEIVEVIIPDSFLNVNEQEVDDNKVLTLKSKDKKDGSIIIKYEDGSEEEFLLTVDKLGVIHGNGNFNDFYGAEAILVSLIIFMLILAVSSIMTIIKSFRNSKYGYFLINEIAILVISVSFILALSNGLFNYYLVPFNEFRGLYLLYNVITFASSLFVVMASPLFFIFAILMIVSNISLIKHEGKSLTNVLGIIISILLIFGYIFFFIMDRNNNTKFHIIASTLYNHIFFFCECILFGTIIVGLKAAKNKPQYDKDYIIIHGCGIKKDGSLLPLLKGRVDRAIEFYHEQKKQNNKKLIIIPSGGKGNDECISEALAMSNYLVKKGISKNDIILEDKSTSTYENLKYSKKLIDDKNSKVLFVTTNYHVFRTGLYAKKLKMNAEGLGSNTKWYFWPNAFIREFIGMITYYKKTLLIEGFIILLFIYGVLMLFIV